MSHDERVRCVRRMLAYLHHRGPDEMGYYADDNIAMGTARLAIVDVRGGQQPIGDDSGRFWIAFNGEIYNHLELRRQLEEEGFHFSTTSDTEVLLYAWMAWQNSMLTRLNGAFAFCIYDRLERSLVLARDRFGKRPLFYVTNGGNIAFVSEMKSLLAYPGHSFGFDRAQLASILSMWAPVEDQTGFHGIYQVPAGCFLRITPGARTLSCYSPLRLQSGELVVDEFEAANSVHDTIVESVRIRVSNEVETGVYLSGGIDSAIVARAVSECRDGTTRSFSISFEDRDFDESPDQELLASYLGTKHTTVNVSYRDIAEHFPVAVWHAETPVFRTALVPMLLLSKEVRKAGIKVILTGEGADEAFLGYDIFKEAQLRSSWSALTPDERFARLGELYPYLPDFSRANKAALYALFDRFSRGIEGELFSHELRLHNSTMSLRLLSGDFKLPPRFPGLTETTPREYSSMSMMRRAQYLEFKTLLSGYLLSSQGDRMSLANSVENRCPFLDPRVVKIALDTNRRFDDGRIEKYMLKRAFASKLPKRIIVKSKQPYRAPDAKAFCLSKPAYLEAIQSEHQLGKLGVVDVKRCAAFAAKMLSKSTGEFGQAENQAFVFLTSLSLLHDQFVEGGARRPPDIDHLFVKTVDGRYL